MVVMNLWILTEEHPKTDSLLKILHFFCAEKKICAFFSQIRIVPVLKNGSFSFTYKVLGCETPSIKNIFIKTIKGSTSFVDYMLFYQESEPKQSDCPVFLIEETKTDDKESRNTGVYQRCSKFVIADFYYRDVPKIMFYNLRVTPNEKPTETYVFGTRLLLTFGVRILGKNLDPDTFKPFTSIAELVAFKQKMRKSPKGNTPFEIVQENDAIRISARLFKSETLSHDPNIGAVSICCAVIRKLGWDKKIEIFKHGLRQENLSQRNKCVLIANRLDFQFENLRLPKAVFPISYWDYESSGEKLGTIFMHVTVENFTNGFSIFDNHAGCEKSYFLTPQKTYTPLQKYADKDAYKAGDKTKIIFIPDLVLNDIDRKTLITIEGKKYENLLAGIKDLENYDSFEKLYLKSYYPTFKNIRTVILYGSRETNLDNPKIGLLLNADGKMILGIKAPSLFSEALRNLRGYWNT